jgi:hypothetical protein
VIRDARFSHCGAFRYTLSRVWDRALPPLLFVMLNPSTADAQTDDPTIRRCIGFAERLGFGAAHVVNVFAYRATDPRELARVGWPQGDRNEFEVLCSAAEVVKRDGAIVAAWGAHARGRPETGRVYRTLAAVAPVFALRLLRDGTPAHPLMLPYSCQLQPYRPGES